MPETLSFPEQQFIENHQATLVTSLPELCPDLKERQVIEKHLIPAFRSLVEDVFDEFNRDIDRKPQQVLLPGQVSSLCKKLDTVIMDHREPLGVDSLFKPVWKKIQTIRQQIKESLEALGKKRCLEILEAKGAKDRPSLHRMGIMTFREEDFEEYGHGFAFASAVLGRSIRKIDHPVLDEIADAVGFPRIAPSEKILEFKTLLEHKGIFTREDLLIKGGVWFQSRTWGHYGKGHKFASAILGKSVQNINPDVLHEIADALSLPSTGGTVKTRTRNVQPKTKLNDEEKAELLDIFRAQGIADIETLTDIKHADFKKMNFGKFKKGRACAAKVLGVAHVDISFDVLKRVGEEVGLPTKKTQTFPFLPPDSLLF